VIRISGRITAVSQTEFVSFALDAPATGDVRAKRR